MEDKSQRKYDLYERTKKFAISVVRFVKKIDRNTITDPIIRQFIKSGTSIGANFSEADDAESGKDFVHKIGICKKEARETIYWLEILRELLEDNEEEINKLSNEAKELVLIFGAIVRKINNKNK